MSTDEKSEASPARLDERADADDFKGDIQSPDATGGEHAGDIEDDIEDDARETTRDHAASQRRGARSSRAFDSLPASPHFWNAVVIACLLAAIVFLLTGHTDATFVLATLGVVAWFINTRNRLRGDHVITDDIEENFADEDEGNRT
ncbi:MAG TPA: hypothetical protein VNA19_05015 [Pyrinomonadaceae bacterium]|jgi:hypothetical protein|nr:hypothetical protein [Pyrinomonadaceae bacterium]